MARYFRTRHQEVPPPEDRPDRWRHGYDVMEQQIRRQYAEAASRPGRPGETLLQILESRLDNVVYRAGLGADPHFLVFDRRRSPDFRVG